MRRRSGGIHCQTYEELVESCRDPFNSHSVIAPTEDTLIRPPCFDIDTLLRQQELSSQNPTHHPQPYFFSQKEELLAQEEEETSRQQYIRSVDVTVICQDILAVYEHLSTVAQAQLLSHKQPLGPSQGRHPSKNTTCINIQSDVQGQVCQCSCSEDRSSEDRNVLERNRQKEEGTIWSKEESFGKVLELVIYNNPVEDYSSKCHNLPSLIQKQIQQHKLWLIPSMQSFPSILIIYLKKSKYIFRATMVKGCLMFIPIPNQGCCCYYKENDEGRALNIRQMLDGRLLAESKRQRY